MRRRSLLGERSDPEQVKAREPAPNLANQLVDRIGKQFVETAKTSRRQAWNDLNDTVMLNLALLSGSRLLEPLRNIIATMMEVDRNILSGSHGGAPSSGQTLDMVAAAWTLDDEDVKDA